MHFLVVSLYGGLVGESRLTDLTLERLLPLQMEDRVH